MLRHVTMIRLLALMVLTIACGPARAWVFGEGFSSKAPGELAEVYFRAFTIYSGQEACAKTEIPNSLYVRLAYPALKVGDRVYRSTANSLIIEARSLFGEFIPSVPVVMDVLADTDVVRSQSDWDYFEIVGPGEIDIRVGGYCGPVGASLHIVIEPPER